MRIQQILWNFLLAVIVSSCGHISSISMKQQNNSSSSLLAKKTQEQSEEIPASAPEDISQLPSSSLSIPQKLESNNNESKGKVGEKVYFLSGAEHLNLKNYYFDIPVVYNEAVKKWIQYFTNKGRSYFESYAARAGRYAPLMAEILERMGLPRDLIFLAMNESGFQNEARSWANAVGPWQFMSFTGKKFGLEINWFLDERKDPLKASVAAAEYLKRLYLWFNNWELAMAAYNAGEGKIGRAIKMYKTENFWKLRLGRYLKSETKEYVPKIMAMAIIGKNLSSFGFEGIDFWHPLDFAEVEVKGGTDLYQVAKDLEITFESLKRLNPEITLWFVPLDKESYSLRIPKEIVGRWEQLASNEKSYVGDAQFQRYKVGKSQTLEMIAKKFKVDKKVLMALNEFENSKLSKGQEILLPFRIGDDPFSAEYKHLTMPKKKIRRAKRKVRTQNKYLKSSKSRSVKQRKR